jgi:hypothetical protein
MTASNGRSTDLSANHHQHSVDRRLLALKRRELKIDFELPLKLLVGTAFFSPHHLSSCSGASMRFCLCVGKAMARFLDKRFKS